jgi:hypothetical protein
MVLINGTFRDFFAKKSLISSLKSSSRSKSLSMLRRESFDGWFCPIMVHSLFFIIFIFENDRSPVQFDTIKTKYILNTISRFRKLALKFWSSKIWCSVRFIFILLSTFDETAGLQCICNLKDFFPKVSIVEAPLLWRPKGYTLGSVNSFLLILILKMNVPL